MEKVKELLKNKKIIMVIVAVLVVILAIFIGSKMFGKSDVEQQISMLFDPEKPISIKVDNKYGFIDTKGNVIIEPKYKKVNDFYGEFAVVRTEENTYEIIDKKGNVKATADDSYDIEYISKNGSWIVSGVLYDSNMKQITKEGVIVDYDSSNEGYLTFTDSNNNKIGVMDATGKKTFEIPVSEAEYLGLDVSENEFDLENTYARVNLDNEKYAIINCNTGKVIYELSEKYITVEENNIFGIKTGDYKSDTAETVYIENDTVAYKVENDIELEYYSKGILRTEDDSKSYSERYGYYDLKTKTLSSDKPSVETPDTWELLTGYMVYECNFAYGLMKDDEVILSCEWDDIDYLGSSLYQYLQTKGKEYLLLEKDSKVNLYNMKSNKVIATFNTTYVSTYSSTFIKYTEKDTKEIVVYNLLTDKTMKFDSETSVTVKSNYITATKDKVQSYYNVELEKIYEQK